MHKCNERIDVKFLKKKEENIDTQTADQIRNSKTGQKNENQKTKNARRK